MNHDQYKPVKTAIVGCGSISDIFFRNFTERFEIIDLVKCCSHGRKSADAKAAQYGIESSTLDEILADPEIEMIVNLTPAMQHFDIIKASLEAGKHVYTEKIITPDFRKTQELVELANQKGLYFGCEPDHFLGSAWQCAREYIDGGILGDVLSIAATTSQNIGTVAERLRFVNEPAGGIGFDFGIYLITQIAALLGPASEVCGMMTTNHRERIHAEVKNPHFNEPYEYINEDMAAAVIRFAGGATAVIHMNANSLLEAQSHFIVYGTNGVMTLPLPATFSGDVKLYRPGAFEPMSVLPAHGFDHDSRGAGAAEMAWSIRLGRKHRANAQLGMHCQEILQGIQESCRTKTFYQMTTTCEAPEPLKKGFRGIPGFSYSEEGSLVF